MVAVDGPCRCHALSPPCAQAWLLDNNSTKSSAGHGVRLEQQ
jgi:hypothetical protein